MFSLSWCLKTYISEYANQLKNGFISVLVVIYCKLVLYKQSKVCLNSYVFSFSNTLKIMLTQKVFYRFSVYVVPLFDSYSWCVSLEFELQPGFVFSIYRLFDSGILLQLPFFFKTNDGKSISFLKNSKSFSHLFIIQCVIMN